MTLHGFVCKAGFLYNYTLERESITSTLSIAPYPFMPTTTEYVEVALVCMQIEYGFFQTLNTSVCRSGNSKSWQREGCTLAEVRKQSSSLEWMNACFSFGQSILNLGIAWVTTSSSSSNSSDWGTCSVDAPAYIQPLWVRCRQHEFFVLVWRIHRVTFEIQNGSSESMESMRNRMFSPHLKRLRRSVPIASTP